MNDYEVRQEDKRSRYLELAKQNQQESDRRYKAARERGSRIPFGRMINNKLLNWMKNLDDGEVPQITPYCLSDHFYYDGIKDFINEYGKLPRGYATSRGMWALVDLTWTSNLASWIGSREVIKVMAGAGWLAKALSIHGINIIATDNLSWNGERPHQNIKPVHPIREFEGLRAVDEFRDADILLCSWPPYGGTAIVEICKAWGDEKPIIYIGEDQGGCNAPDEFFDKFQMVTEMDIPQHNGSHDFCQIGYFKLERAGLTP